MKYLACLVSLAAVVRAGTTVWSGSFTPYTTSSDFDLWSWSNQVGEYQWYIHGSSATSAYLALDPSYKNPASSESHGLKLTIDSSSHWNGQTFQRTEIIPQTSSNIGTGKLWYHFSIKHSATNPPDSTVEHQILFFESHFTELKYGVGSPTTNLQWYVNGVSKWGVPWAADVWHNFAYEIDFSGGSVALWHSTGSDALALTVSAVSVSASSNSADFHVGVLAFGSSKEDYYLSGVYVESGSITTSVGTGGGGSGTTSIGGTTTSKPITTATTTTKPITTVSTTTTSSGPVGSSVPHYGQCGGIGYTGSTTCASPYKCTVSNAYYSQCL